MKKVLIIGGNGFIGRNLSLRLVNEFEVYSFDIKFSNDINNSINYINGDFFDDEQLFAALNGKDIVVHAISSINPGNSNEKYMRGYIGDLVQSVKVFEYASNNNQELLFLSSGGTVYGEVKNQPIKEEVKLNPINHYGNIKVCLESIIKTYNIQNKSKFKIARISNPYGPGQDFKKGVGFIDAALKNAIEGSTLEIWGDGEVIRDYIYIDDVCEFLLNIIKYEGEESIFNVSSGVGSSQNQVLSLIKELGFEVSVNYKDTRSVDIKSSILDNSKIKRISDVNCLDLKTGIIRYAAYLKENYTY